MSIVNTSSASIITRQNKIQRDNQDISRKQTSINRAKAKLSTEEINLKQKQNHVEKQTLALEQEISSQLNPVVSARQENIDPQYVANVVGQVINSKI